jgi:hypothetical protein
MVVKIKYTVGSMLEMIRGKPMDATMTAIELTGTIDENRHLQLDDLPPAIGPKRVRVILLYSLEDEWDEQEWLRAAAKNPAFAFLKDEEEDIYTLSDGKPLQDEV